MKVGMVAGGIVMLMAVGESMAGAGESDQGASSELTLIGEVSEPMTIAGHALPEGRPAIIVSVDPKFFCRIKLERVISGQAPWRTGAEVVLLFHSPTRTFLDGSPAGKRYRFTFDVTKDAGDAACYVLRKAGIEAAGR